GNYTLGEDSWAGLGWTLHLGRVLVFPASPLLRPIIEMPDGSRHPSYAHMNGTIGRYITRDFWTYDTTVEPPVLRLPNGVIYTYGRQITIGTQTYRYTTSISDPFGNHIDIAYMTGGSVPSDGISTVTQVLESGTT